MLPHASSGVARLLLLGKHKSAAGNRFETFTRTWTSGAKSWAKIQPLWRPIDKSSFVRNEARRPFAVLKRPRRTCTNELRGLFVQGEYKLQVVAPPSLFGAVIYSCRSLDT